MPRGRPKKTLTPQTSAGDHAPQDQAPEGQETVDTEQAAAEDCEILERREMADPVVPQGQAPAPDGRQYLIPLNARIDSLETGGAVRAFASADYGDLTIRRIRVKQDGNGVLSVSMPKFKQIVGWKDTCSFNTEESRDRLDKAILDAYDQEIAQLHGQSQSGADAQEQDERQEQGWQVMSLC